MSFVSLREARVDLLERHDLRGIAFCRAHSEAADQWILQLASHLQPSPHVALLAVGGYGRGELSPFSDLDLVLVHEGVRKINEIADQLWYPIWDAGIKLDHSVRTPKELFSVAEEDLRVALGLLDARLVWGNAEFARPIVERVRELWRGSWGDQFLPELESQMSIRHEQRGDLTDLLEPDLKEAHGGLRDVNVLEAVHWAFPDVARTADFDQVFAARDILLLARVELHRVAGRNLDRLLLQEQDQVALRCEFTDADALMKSISAAARVVARASDSAWRRRGHWRQLAGSEPDDPVSIEDGIELYDGEVRLSSLAPVASDVTLTMRLAALSSSLDVPMSIASLARLSSEAPEPPFPWPGVLRRSFVSLLSSGDGFVTAVEALDDFDLFSRHLPEWEHVRSFHQRNAYHRFTVDRHLLETVLHARESLTSVAQPDLLLLGALFHDIGKGLGRDHTEAGIELAQSIGPRMGLSDADAATLVLLVRHHLLLSDVATRRDLDDPATIRYVAAAVGDEQTLELLSVLARADGLSTGPSAWGPWKAQLVDDLTRRVRHVLQGHDLVVEAKLDHDVLGDVATNGLVVRREDDWIIVATSDQPGILATITGVLALFAIDIRSADLTSIDGVVIDRFYCAPGPRGWPSDDDMLVAMADGLGAPEKVAVRLVERAANAPTARRSAHAHDPLAHLIPAASEASTVVEVIASDKVGLLESIARAVATAGFDITAARLSTVGDVAIDTFYVRRGDGHRLALEEHAPLLSAIHEAIAEAN